MLSLLIQAQDVDNRWSTKAVEGTVPLLIGFSYANEETVLVLLAWLEMI